MRFLYTNFTARFLNLTHKIKLTEKEEIEILKTKIRPEKDFFNLKGIENEVWKRVVRFLFSYFLYFFSYVLRMALSNGVIE